MIDLDELARLEREANAEQEAEDAALVKLDAGESVSVHDSVWAPTARDALTVAMRNALPELLRIARWHAEHPWDAAVGKQLLDAARAELAAMTERAERAEANFRWMVERERTARAEVERLRGALHSLLPWAENWLPDEAKDQGARAAISASRAALKGEGE